MIYILGGAFDPPHAGHSAIVRSILHFLSPDQIIILPSGKRNDKTYNISDEYRLSLLQIFVEEIANEKVIIDDYFIKNWQ